MNIIIGFLVGSIFTLLVATHVTGMNYENEIKKDVLIQEILKENKQYKKHYETVSDMNKDYWG